MNLMIANRERKWNANLMERTIHSRRRLVRSLRLANAALILLVAKFHFPKSFFAADLQCSDNRINSSSLGPICSHSAREGPTFEIRS